ncbi:hypothetical protein OG500_27275 [Kitasatospora sp. NBC_01250]|uniref:hypothetical protein n=1 Tax=unclassified Kitasatospora TaxID=2633591 RepID=UPI002E0F4722|nr:MULTISPECIES: hypothetical protein [unclassified Kitasatospora]WSJ69820.1 hypothetical protein OG294_29035 [Kitasatospora sp. NBC_01302]
MDSKWTTVLLSTALAGAIATTTGIAVSSASPLAADRRHPMISPAVAPDAAGTMAAMGALGGVLQAVNQLVTVSAPGSGTATEEPALQGRLGQLGMAAEKLKSVLPATAGDAAQPSGAAAPSGAAEPSAPSVPAGVLPGGPIQRLAAPLPTAAAEDRLAALQKDAAALVAVAKQGDQDAVRAALAPLSADTLALSSATVARLAAG